MAVAGTPTVAVTARPDGGQPNTLALVDTSGYPPYTAIVNVPLGDDAAGAVDAAARGTRDRVLVTVTARLAPDLPLVPEVLASTALTVSRGAGTATATVTSDLADWAIRTTDRSAGERNEPC